MVAIPTLQELYNSVLNDLKQELGITSSIFGKAFLVPLAAVQAAKLKLYYLAIAGVQKNIFVDTADSENRGGTLERFGRVKLGRSPFPATAGVYVLDVTGTASALISASTTFKSNDGNTSAGKLYILDTAYTLTGSGDQITVRALEAGTASDLAVGDVLTATAPILNVEREFVVDSISTNPVDSEDLETYRAKTIEAFQLEPQGGAASDYIIWSADANGVKKVYPYTSGATANTVDLYVEATAGNGVANSTLIAEVADVIEQDPDTTKPLYERGRRPLGILQVNTQSVSIGDVEVTVTGLNTNTVAIQTAIESALTAMLATVRPFIAGADVLADRNDTLTPSKVAVAVQGAIGNANYFSGIAFTVNATPVTGSYKFTAGEIPELTNVTYN